MRRIFSFVGALYKRVLYFLKGLGTKRKWVAIVLAVVIIGGVGYALFGPENTSDTEPVEDRLPVVELFPVETYAQNTSGSVSTANSEAVVRAESSGKIIKVLPVGTRVSSGTTIAQFENSSQRAALLQAEGALEGAQASLEKTKGGPRSEQITVLEVAFENAQSNTVATLLSAYATIDSAVRDTGDQVFSNPESGIPSLTFVSTNSQRVTELENKRVFLNIILNRQSSVSSSLSNDSDFETELTITGNEVREVRAFIDTLIAALNEAITTETVTEANIAGYKLSATNARIALTTTLSSIASARASLETSKQNLDQGLTGAEDTDIASAAASVKQAQGAYNAALASYNKTIVRAPVSGTIISCSAGLGDVLSIGSDVCRVRAASSASGDVFILPLSSVKYSPTGAFVFIVSSDSTLEAVEVNTGLVTASGITVTDLFGDEYVVHDVRGLKEGEAVRIEQDNQ